MSGSAPDRQAPRRHTSMGLPSTPGAWATMIESRPFRHIFVESMSNKPVDLGSISAAKAKLAEELRKLEKQEAELRSQQASQAFDRVMGLLNEFGGHFSSRQKADISGFFALDGRVKKGAPSKQEVQPKYWLPHTGETWSGRGRTPKAFAAWEGTAAYKEWKASHPNEKFPKFPG